MVGHDQCALVVEFGDVAMNRYAEDCAREQAQCSQQQYGTKWPASSNHATFSGCTRPARAMTAAKNGIKHLYSRLY